MRIVPNFLNGSAWWQAYVSDNCAKASAILSDASFLEWVSKHGTFDDTNDVPAAVSLRLQSAGDVKINVSFYWNPFGVAIASEGSLRDGSHVVYVNTAKYKYGAGSAGNMAHETMHGLDYEHAGNSPLGNQNTVPWAIGNEVEKRNDAATRCG